MGRGGGGHGPRASCRVPPGAVGTCEWSGTPHRQGISAAVYLSLTSVPAFFLPQLNKTPSRSKKVTFGLNRNMTTGECGMCLQLWPAPPADGPGPVQRQVRALAEPSFHPRVGGWGRGGWGLGVWRFLEPLGGGCLVGDVNGHLPTPTCLGCAHCLGLRFNGLSAVAAST